MKTAENNVYDVHFQQKLATPHTQDRYGEFKRIDWKLDIIYYS